MSLQLHQVHRDRKQSSVVFPCDSCCFPHHVVRQRQLTPVTADALTRLTLGTALLKIRLVCRGLQYLGHYNICMRCFLRASYCISTG